MTEQKNFEQSQSVFSALCQTLDKRQFHYKKLEEKLSIECGIQGEDLPINITVKIDPKRLLVLLVSHFSFTVQEDKRLDMAIAVSAVNNILVDGSFDYDVSSGHMYFRMTNSFIESSIGEDLFMYMIFCSAQTIDEYNDKFLMLSKGMISVEQFVSSLED